MKHSLLLLAIVFSLGAGPAMDDAAFFKALDLSRPDLADVKTAVDRGDLTAAKHAFVQHLKNRTSPKFQPETKISDADMKNADRYVKNDLVSCAVWFDFKDHLDWNSNPMPDKYNEWTWQLNRHPFWDVLGRAYLKTGDEKYAKAFVYQMTDWVHSQPEPADSGNKAFSSWRTIETGIRMFSSWPDSFYEFLNSPTFDDDSIILMVKSFYDHADHLMKFPTTGNWLTMESNGLYHVGVLFPESRDAQKWRDTGIGRLDAELDKQVYPDGAQIELSTSYHNVALNSFEMPVKLAKQNDLSLPADYIEKMQRMFNYDLYLSMPDRHLPPMNDAGETDIHPWMQKGFGYFPERADFQWIATDGKQGQPPQKLSYEFPYAGYYVMRSGWDADARYMLLDAGPFGYGHQHEDKLTIVAAAYGRVHVIDPGNYPYDTSKWRAYFIDTFAHNTVLVDGQPQRRRGEKDRWAYVVKQPQPHAFFTSDSYDYSAGTYDEGYGDKKEKIATHHRDVIYVKSASGTHGGGEYWLVLDTLTPHDQAEHSYDAMFHLNADAAAIDSKTFTTLTNNKIGSNFAIVPAVDSMLSTTDEAGQEKPFVQGWVRVNEYGVRPTPTPVYHKKSAGVTTFAFVLFPLHEKESLPITSFDGSTIQFGDKGSDKIELTGNPNQPVKITHSP